MIHFATGSAAPSTQSQLAEAADAAVLRGDDFPAGDGVQVAGTLLDVRTHSVGGVRSTNGKSTFVRFSAIRVRADGSGPGGVSPVRRRVFRMGDDKSVVSPTKEAEAATPTSGGAQNPRVEVETQLVDRTSIKRTGYLSTVHGQRDDPEAISVDDWLRTLGGQAVPAKWYAGVAGVHPAERDVLEFWGDATYMRGLDLKEGDKVRLKTKGDTVLIESVAKETELATHFHGEQQKGTWTDQISKGDQKDDKPVPGEELEGVDDDEWD